MYTPTRTPEGSPGRCRVCGYRFYLEASWPGGDAPCPACGSLVWVGPVAPPVMPPDAPPRLRRRALRANAGVALAAGFWLAAAALPNSAELFGLGAPELVALGVIALVLFWRGIR